MPETIPPGAATDADTGGGEFDRFHAAHAAKTGSFHDVSWSWVSAGDSSLATLLLPPSPGFAALLGGLIEAMAPKQRVIVPTYPAIPDSRALVHGLAEICRAEGVTRLNLVGFGFGGVLAQLFAKRGAGVVNKIVLVNTTTPEAWVRPKDRTAYNTARLAPAWALRRLALGRIVSQAGLEKEERPRWRRLIRACLAQRVDKWESLALRAAGFDAQRLIIEDDGWSLPGFEGRIQIVESGKDRRITDAQRTALKEACPAAHVRKVADAGHWLGCVHPERLIGIVDTFLNDVNIIDRTPGADR